MSNADHAQLPGGVLGGAWLYDEPGAANTPRPATRAGLLLLLPSLAALGPALGQGATDGEHEGEFLRAMLFSMHY